MSQKTRRERDGIYRRSDSPNYWVSFIDARGKRTRRSTGTANKEEANAMLAKWRLETREQQHWGKEEIRLFEEMMLVYLQEVSVNKRSYEKDKSHAKRLLEHFAGVDCSRWSQSDRRSYVRKRLATGISNASMNRELSTLSAATKHMVREHDWRVDNICSGGRLKEGAKSFRWFTEDEAEALVRAAASEPNSIGTVDFIILSLNTGMRCHELLHEIIEGVEVGLTWDRVDLKNGLIYLHSEHQKNGKVGSVPLNNAARQALLSRAGFRATFCPGARYVFCRKDGVPIKSMKRSYATACKRAKLGHTKIHTMRHTCASWMVQRGVSIEKVQEVLRHADIKTTMRYAHLSPINARQAVEALEHLESRFSHAGDLAEKIELDNDAKSLSYNDILAP